MSFRCAVYASRHAKRALSAAEDLNKKKQKHEKNSKRLEQHRKFATSIDDFVASSLLSSGAGSETVPVKIYGSVRGGATPALNALATIMPSVGAELGGYGYFSWATAGFLVGAILASASSGRLAELFGLRAATALAGVIMAVGCVMSALAPDITMFLAGRVVQGLGSGWISGFAMVAIALLFPERHLARVFAAVTFVWGVATVLGPLVGGLVLALMALGAFLTGFMAYYGHIASAVGGGGGRGERAGPVWLQTAQPCHAS